MVVGIEAPSGGGIAEKGSSSHSKEYRRVILARNDGLKSGSRA